MRYMPNNMEATIYNAKGTKTGTFALPKEIFEVAWNPDLVHQAIVSMRANARTNVAHTKNRAEVSGGGKKPWKQKGTGRARHGSTRSPIWRKGGITHGPRNEKEFGKALSKKMREKAFLSALSRKYKDGEIIFLDTLAFSKPQAKEAKAILSALSKVDGFAPLATKRKNAALIAIPTNDLSSKRSFRNFGNVEVEEARNLNPLDLLTHKFLVVVGPEESVKLWSAKSVIRKAK